LEDDESEELVRIVPIRVRKGEVASKGNYDT